MRWRGIWLFLWAVNVVLLAVAAFVMSPVAWATLFVVLFLLPELVALRREDGYPPLTHVVVWYVPRWVAESLTFGCGAWLSIVWWQKAVHPLLAVVIVASFVGWLHEHWVEAYRANSGRR